MFALFACLSCAGALSAENYLVLPFFNNTQDKGLDWIGDSLSEAVREAMAGEGLVALDREDRSEAFQRLSIRPYVPLTKASVLKIGSVLDAEQVIYGGFELTPIAGQTSKTRGTLRVTAHILDLKHMRQGPDFGELGALEDLATMQRHLAWQTLQFVAPKSTPPEEDFIKQHPAVRADAIENYVRGLLAASAEDRKRFFTQAVKLDAKYSQPCFQLGKLYLQSKEYKVAAEWLEKVSPDDAHSREANFLLGLCRFHEGDYGGAASAFESVARVVPLNEVYNNLGAAQSRRNVSEALDSFQKALEGDEGDPTYHFNVGYALWKQSKFDAAAVRFRAVLERNPDDEDAKVLLARCEKHLGPRAADTRTASLERLKANYEESAWWQLKAALQKD